MTIRLVESEMLELAPRDGWSGYLRRMVAAAVEAKRAELAARSRRASTG